MKELILVLGKNSKFFIFTISKVKMRYIILKLKNVSTVFYMQYCTWQTTRKMIKSSKIDGGKLTNFCLGREIRIGHGWDSCFTLSAKIHVLGSKILKVLLNLVSNRNCVRKSFGLIWTVLEITSLNWSCCLACKSKVLLLFWSSMNEFYLKHYEIQQLTSY